MYVYMFVYLRKFVHFLHTQLCYKKWESICCATWACYLSTCSSEQTGMEFRKLEHGLRMTSGILVMVVVAAWTTAVAGLLMFSCAGGGAGEGSDGCFFLPLLFLVMSSSTRCHYVSEYYVRFIRFVLSSVWLPTLSLTSCLSVSVGGAAELHLPL